MILDSGSLDAKKQSVYIVSARYCYNTCAELAVVFNSIELYLYKAQCGLFVLGSMWFEGYSYFKKSMYKNTKEKQRKHAVQNQELISDSFSTVRLQLTVHAYASTIAVCNSLAVHYCFAI